MLTSTEQNIKALENSLKNLRLMEKQLLNLLRQHMTIKVSTEGWDKEYKRLRDGIAYTTETGIDVLFRLMTLLEDE